MESKQQELLTKITQLTKEIEDQYPELSKYLNENPQTIPNTGNPKISIKELEDYLESLVSQLKTYREDH